MASTYPTSIDAFTNPLTTDLLTSPSHAEQHANINDAVEALEAKVAIGNTVLGTYTAYTPTINVVVGNGTLTSSYCRVNNFVHYFGKVIFGSTTTVGGGGLSLVLPINMDANFSGSVNAGMGFVSCRDASASQTINGSALTTGSATTVYLESTLANSTYALGQAITSTTPFTWTTSDILFWNFYYKAA